MSTVLQTASVKTLALRVLEEMAARNPSRSLCPTQVSQVGQSAAGQLAGTNDDPMLLRDVADPSLSERMAACVRQFGQPHAYLFPLIGKKVATPRGAGRLITVFAQRCEVVLDVEPERMVCFRPDEVGLAV